MKGMLYRWLASVDWYKDLFIMADITARLVICILAGYIAGKIAGRFVSRILAKPVEDEKTKFNIFLLEKGVIRRLVLMFPVLFLYFAAELIFTDTPNFLSVLVRILYSLLIILGIYCANAFIDALDAYYNILEISRKNPIKGYLQLIKIFIATLGVILIASEILKKSPWGMLSGLGAMTALVLLVFRDWILGLVASIQINANNLVVIGDSIEMERYGVNGEVIEISLSTVKVKNWDNTISMIPAYSLISETFKNRHGIQESGGRRIKGVMYIDITSIELPDVKTLKKIQSLELLGNSSEMKNLIHGIRKSRASRLNSSELTNAGIFRRYTELYLSGRPGINSDAPLKAKLLEPTEHGLPLQIYAFTGIINLPEYEDTVSEIIEHLAAAAPEFGLRLFQNPSWNDVRK